MKVFIKPSQLSGTIYAAASKSSMQRACAAALLAGGKTVLTNPGHSNDDKAAMSIIEHLGARLTEKDEQLIIESGGVKPVLSQINTGESGLSIRMFTPIVALSEHEIVINGEGSLLNRPMDFFDEVLPKLGVKVISSSGRLPLRIQGPLEPGNIEIDGSLSSQFLTGLLMAYSAAGASNVSIKVKELKSRPYIDLTLAVMQHFGLKLPENRDYREFYFDASESKPADGTHEYTVEGDWSGGAFLLVAGAIAGPITVRGLDMNSAQADKKIVDALMAAGAGIAIEAKQIKMHPLDMKAFDFDATDCPDLFPPLVALAAYCKGITRIQGVGRLIHKESNRAETLRDEFKKFGVRVDLEGDTMSIHGGSPLKGAETHSRHDHRIAMACAIAALKAEGETKIIQAQAVDKSYPDFYQHLRKLHGAVGGKFIHSQHA